MRRPRGQLLVQVPVESTGRDRQVQAVQVYDLSGNWTALGSHHDASHLAGDDLDQARFEFRRTWLATATRRDHAGQTCPARRKLLKDEAPLRIGIGEEPVRYGRLLIGGSGVLELELVEHAASRTELRDSLEPSPWLQDDLVLRRELRV